MGYIFDGHVFLMVVQNFVSLTLSLRPRDYISKYTVIFVDKMHGKGFSHIFNKK